LTKHHLPFIKDRHEPLKYSCGLDYGEAPAYRQAGVSVTGYDLHAKNQEMINVAFY
jgi:hypothetical protein